jgi:hypothetical protein
MNIKNYLIKNILIILIIYFYICFDIFINIVLFTFCKDFKYKIIMSKDFYSLLNGDFKMFDD